MNTTIIKCDCNCKEQDILHGDGLRVANRTQSDLEKWRCTSCRKLHTDFDRKKEDSNGETNE